MPDNSLSALEPMRAVRPPWLLCLRSDVGSASAVVVVAGELDIATVGQLDEALRNAEVDSALVVLDLRALEFIDSSGAHLLVAADRRMCQAGGRLLVVRGRAEVDRLFALTGLDRQLELVDHPPADGGGRAVWEGASA